MTPSLVSKICARTWVSDSWLLEGDPKAPIRGLIKGPYLRQYFKFAQTLTECGENPVTNATKLLGPIMKDLLTDASNAGELKNMTDHLRELMTKVRLSGRYLKRENGTQVISSNN